jgi:hypothetical protein
MAHLANRHFGLKAGGLLLSIAGLVTFLALAIGPVHSDWGLVTSFVAIFVGFVIFEFGLFMK